MYKDEDCDDADGGGEVYWDNDNDHLKQGSSPPNLVQIIPKWDVFSFLHLSNQACMYHFLLVVLSLFFWGVPLFLSYYFVLGFHVFLLALLIGSVSSLFLGLY